MTTSIGMLFPSLPYLLALIVAFVICITKFSRHRKAARLCLFGLVLMASHIVFSLGSFFFVQWFVSNANNQGGNPEVFGFVMMAIHLCSSLVQAAGIILIVISVFAAREPQTDEDFEKTF